jgi:hypothetical protein
VHNLSIKGGPQPLLLHRVQIAQHLSSSTSVNDTVWLQEAQKLRLMNEDTANRQSRQVSESEWKQAAAFQRRKHLNLHWTPALMLDAPRQRAQVLPTIPRLEAPAPGEVKELWRSRDRLTLKALS